MRYWLMRKNKIITLLDFDDYSGTLLKYSHDYMNNDEAPLEYSASKNDNIKRWWSNRSIPVGQGVVHEMLEKKGLISSDEYLLNNLGLSLTDYYWIRPVDSNLKWEDVNLFDNNFKENLLVKIDDDCGYRNGSFTSFSPNGSLQGQIEKTWQIRDGKRILIKGNSDNTSYESLNEVFASLLHKKQGYDNYTEYKLIKIKNKEYSFGCRSNCFTSQDKELVSAWAVISSEKKSNNLNEFEHFIEVCASHGIDEIQLRKDLDYQIMTDYILSNRDRHMNNISILRDAKTLKFIRMAPIYDTGKSMFVRRFDMKYSDIINYDVNSFYKTERQLLDLVSDRTLVDASKLPTSNDLAALYKKDPNIPQSRIDMVCKYYETKVEAFKRWQDE